MSDPVFVKLHYGPYEANGIIRHKSQRLHGIIQCLSKLGYHIEIVPSVHLNRLSVEMLHREIFRCDIQNLLFNTECQDDNVCMRIVEVVEEAKGRMCSESNLPQYVPLSKGVRVLQHIRDAKTTQDQLPDVKLWFEIPKNSLATVFQAMQAESAVEIMNHTSNSSVT